MVIKCYEFITVVEEHPTYNIIKPVAVIKPYPTPCPCEEQYVETPERWWLYAKDPTLIGKIMGWSKEKKTERMKKNIERFTNELNEQLSTIIRVANTSPSHVNNITIN